MALKLDLAEWSYFWLGVERAELARGTVVAGRQMYVEYWIPREVKHPYPVVFVHGGGGQGLDWMATPDGRPGWAMQFLAEGYSIYVVDRPGHGRSPYHPDLHGPFPAQATTYEQMMRQFTAPEKAAQPYGPQAKLHTQWPGAGTAGDPVAAQTIAAQGGSFLPDLEATHEVWRKRLGELFDRIGPAMIMSHSMGGPSAWIAADARPELVKGILAIEPAGPPMGNLKWGVTACKLRYEPPARDPGDLKTVRITPTEPNQDPYFLQAEPARKLVNVSKVPILLLTAEASYHAPYDPGTVAYLKQAGCKVDFIRIADKGIHGNGHFLMMEKNNREALQPVLDWAAANVEKGVALKPSKAGDTALALESQGSFWVGTGAQKMAYGTISTPTMYVQHLTPAEVKQPLPIVLVHGGGGQMLTYMGTGGGSVGWAHYYVQAGYKVYLVDRPGHGRSLYHPDQLGAIGPVPTYANAVAEFERAAQTPNPQWNMNAATTDHYMAGAGATPRDNDAMRALWAKLGAELLDRIGPAILQTHSAGGPFGWLTASERPALVKGIVCVEGATAPVEAPLTAKLRGIPIAIVTAERSGRIPGPIVAALKQAGCDADDVQLKDLGILGNGHYMMIENNRKQVFDALRGWIERRVKA
jgi:pimeloyl-ACP methyl ester carboxylesterase